MVGEGLLGRGEFRLNGQPLGMHGETAEAFAFPITEALLERNELTIDVHVTGPDGGLCGDVALEIRRRAWLTDLVAEPAGGGQLRISGAIRGEVDPPMDLYVMADGHSVGYQSCSSAGLFQIVTDAADSPATEVRIELVGGAVVWHVSEITSR